MDKKTQKTMFSSERGDWGTPRWLFDLLNDEFDFKLDVAAQDDEPLDTFYMRRAEALELKKMELRIKHGLGHEEPLVNLALAEFLAYEQGFRRRMANFLCPQYFTAEHDAFKQIWDGGAGAWFLNPPYGRGIGKWMRACKEQRVRRPELPNGSTGVALVPARTDTKWFWDYGIHGADEIRLLKGRLRFEGAPSGAPFPSAVIIYRPCDEQTQATEARIVPWDPPRPKGAVILAND